VIVDLGGMTRSRRRSVVAFCAAMIIGILAAQMAQSDSVTPGGDINAVLAAHDKEIMKLPNVVGVYVGVLEDRKTPCLKVMLSKASPTTAAALPPTIDGFRVVTEVTGEIKPLQGR
jgi:hypothetical protein